MLIPLHRTPAIGAVDAANIQSSRRFGFSELPTPDGRLACTRRRCRDSQVTDRPNRYDLQTYPGP
eukprot:32259-Eustigmatos_ZCMA.PRE.1